MCSFPAKTAVGIKRAPTHRQALLPYRFLAGLGLLFLIANCYGQEIIPLYNGPIPNSLAVPDEEKSQGNGEALFNVSRPTLTAYLPPKEKATGAAVIICPGGGYGALVIRREGEEVAQAFVNAGLAAFVLKYRLPNDRIMPDKTIGPLQDARQAIRMVRQRAAAWGIRPDKIGILGFSAGGHLASTAGTHLEPLPGEPAAAGNARPDFMVLVYPVISMSDEIGKGGSRQSLLGASPTKELILRYSNETRVSAQTPPAFLVHAGDDSAVPVAHSIRFYEALQQRGIPAELHVYARGEHGFLAYPARQEWIERCLNWLKNLKIVD